MGRDKIEKKKIHRVQRLRERHSQLHMRAEELSGDPKADQVLVATIKKQKLHTLDQLRKFEPEQVLA